LHRDPMLLQKEEKTMADAPCVLNFWLIKGCCFPTMLKRDAAKYSWAKLWRLNCRQDHRLGAIIKPPIMSRNQSNIHIVWAPGRPSRFLRHSKSKSLPTYPLHYTPTEVKQMEKAGSSTSVTRQASKQHHLLLYQSIRSNTCDSVVKDREMYPRS
jgi:hypothetical protein